MTTDFSEFPELREAEVLNEIKNLMINEGIRPQAEYEFFSKYFANTRKKNYLDDEDEILHLVNSHGVEIRNDVKYYLDNSKVNSTEVVKKEVPVLNPKHFPIEDFNDMIIKLKELPSEWTVLQITKKFSLNDVTRIEEIPEIYLTRFACGELAERIHPYSVTTEDRSNFKENIFKILKNLMEMRKEFYSLGRKNKLWEAYNKTNFELETLIKELESFILGPFLCLFQGRMEDSDLERETLTQVEKLVNSFCEEEQIKVKPNPQTIDLIYQLTCAAHLIKNEGLFNVLKLLFGRYKNLTDKSRLVMFVENIKILNLSNSCAVKRAKKKPLILVIDNEFEMVPWEMLGSLTGQPVCRISSLHLLYSLYKYHEPFIKNGYRIVEIDCTYCLLNPGGDLQECEKRMKEFLKKRIPWAEVVCGKAPESKELLTKMEEYSAYLYCGHGSGNQYLKGKDLRRTFMKGLILLFGCSSNIPRNRGGRTPHQGFTYTYLINGCPCVIGCIQDLGSKDADVVCQEVLTNIFPTVTLEGSQKVVLEPKESDILKALAAARLICPKFWYKSAFAARGIPCKTSIGNVKTITGVV